jgi:lipoprotein
MKKLFVIILAALLFLCSCDEQKTEYAEGYETSYHSPKGTSLSLNGIFYNDENEDSNGYSARRLWFYDFDSMQSVILCARPNCLHNDPDTCTAFGINCWDAYPTIVNNKLYYFSRDYAWDDDGKLLINTYVWKASTGGSSRTKIDTIEDLIIYDLAVKGSVVYFTTVQKNYEDYTGVDTGFAKSYICSYDYENEKFTNYGLLAEGYHMCPFIMGEYNGGLYIYGSYADNYDDDYHEWNNFYLRLNLETGEISEWDMPISSLNEYGSLKGMFVGGGYYGYMDGDNAVIFDSAGESMVIENFELSNYAPINGYHFDVYNGTAINLSNGETLKINKKNFPEHSSIICYHNGYIIRNDAKKSEFVKISDEEIFKE